MAKANKKIAKIDQPLSLESAHEVEAATGSTSVAFQRELLAQVTSALWLPKGKTGKHIIQAVKGVYEALQRIAPRSELEGMLAAQMISTHNAAMECLCRAMNEEQTLVGRDHNLKHAAKLLSLYERQLAALDKHRGKGQQKITVEHVTVQAGGQAIVGNVEGGSVERGNASPASPALEQTPNVDAVLNSKSVGGELTQASQRRSRGKRIER